MVLRVKGYSEIEPVKVANWLGTNVNLFFILRSPRSRKAGGVKSPNRRNGTKIKKRAT
jgi:hypothetical protein